MFNRFSNGDRRMEQAMTRLHDKIAALVTALAGPGASARARRRVRLFLGVAAIIAANVWLGAWIGHGLAAILGAGAFFVIAFADPETEEE
jgi:type VI protein secretion system component VasF